MYFYIFYFLFYFCFCEIFRISLNTIEMENFGCCWIDFLMIIASEDLYFLFELKLDEDDKTRSFSFYRELWLAAFDAFPFFFHLVRLFNVVPFKCFLFSFQGVTKMRRLSLLLKKRPPETSTSIFIISIILAENSSSKENSILNC